ncbi:hypothetical protein FRC11_010326 [Ceratobasidium sp. 423]|nr:hypothetical protein FRC11_010326 [Ceratobasidium sp. 423]
MPPLISVPIPSPITTSNPSFDLAIKQHAAQPEPNPTIVEGPASSAVTNDSPTNDLPPKSDTIPKPSSSKIGFSPLRWFGFGGSSSPAVENKPVEVKPVEVKPVEVEPVEVRPIEVKAAETNPVEIKPVEVTPVEVMPVEVKPVEVVKSVEAKPAEMKPVEVKTAEAKPAEINPAERKPVEIEPVEVKHIIVHPVPVKPVEAPATAPSQSSKVVEGREKQPKVTLVPIRKAASPSSPDSPAVEKTTWSRWPYQPAVITSIPPVRPRVPLARDSVPIPARSDGQAVPPRPGRVPPVSTMPPIIPITPISAVSPPTPAKADPAHSRRSHRTNGASLPTLPTLVHTQDTSTHKEKKERSAKRPSATARAPSPTPDILDVAFQSPRSSEDSLPAYTPQAPNVDRDPKPAPRGILKQRITPPTTPPEAETPIATDPTRAVPQVSKFEFMGSRNVPTYDDWGHAPPVRKDVLSNTSAPRSREAQPPSPMTPPPSSRSRTTGDSIHRSRSKHSLKELGSVPNKVNHPRTPSPSPPRETKATPKTTVTPPKPNLVPVLNEKIIRTKAPKPAKISTTRNTGDVHTQPLISPILLTSENYGARLPENKVYQYDGAYLPFSRVMLFSYDYLVPFLTLAPSVRISPSESLSPTIRKAIFDTLQKQVAPQVFPVLARPSFDGKKMLYVHKRLNVSSRQEFSVELPEDGQEPQVYIVQLKRIAVITPQIALDFR